MSLKNCKPLIGEVVEELTDFLLILSNVAG